MSVSPPTMPRTVRGRAKVDYMGIDQWGQTFHRLGPHPRKALVEMLGYKHVDKMYRDKRDGRTVHVGYVVGPHWVTLYEVRPLERE